MVHLAGVPADAAVEELDGRLLDLALAPRVAGAWHLHQAAERDGLAAFVVLSAAAGMLGSPGQGSFAAAGAFLDTMAAWRRLRGLPALSLACPVAEYLPESALARVRAAGVIPVDAARALSLLDAGLAGTSPAVLGARIDTGMLADRARAGQLPALLRGLVPGSARAVPGGTASGGTVPGGLAAQLAGLDSRGRLDVVLQLVQAQAATVLGHGAPRAVEPGSPFRDLGFDSVIAVEFRNRMAGATGLRLPATLIFDYPTPAALATYLSGLLLPSQPVRKAIFADIEQWNEALPGIDLDQDERKEIALRLRGLLRILSTVPEEASASDQGDDLDSDEKLFSALDMESEFLEQNKYT
jgi:polyene macrolide polyketide synthase